jgi:hypothetical protein
MVVLFIRNWQIFRTEPNESCSGQSITRNFKKSYRKTPAGTNVLKPKSLKRPRLTIQSDERDAEKLSKLVRK